MLNFKLFYRFNSENPKILQFFFTVRLFAKRKIETSVYFAEVEFDSRMEVESGLFGITRFDPVENVKPAEDEPGLSAKEKLLKKARDRAAKRKLRDTVPAEN